MNQQHFTNRQSSQRSNFLLTQVLKKGDREQFTPLRPRSITRSSLPAVSLIYPRKHLQRKVLGCADALTHNLTHDRKCVERSGCETVPQNRRNGGANGVERAKNAHLDASSEATDQKAGGSNPSWRARKGAAAKLSFCNGLFPISREGGAAMERLIFFLVFPGKKS